MEEKLLSTRLLDCYERIDDLNEELEGICSAVPNVDFDMEKVYNIYTLLGDSEDLMWQERLIDAEKKVKLANEGIDEIVRKGLRIKRSTENSFIKKENASFVSIRDYESYKTDDNYSLTLVVLDSFINEMLDLSEDDYLRENDDSISGFFDVFENEFKQLSIDDTAFIIRDLFFKVDGLLDIYSCADLFDVNDTVLGELGYHLNHLLLREVEGGKIEKYSLIRDRRRKQKYYLYGVFTLVEQHGDYLSDKIFSLERFDDKGNLVETKENVKGYYI